MIQIPSIVTEEDESSFYQKPYSYIIDLNITNKQIHHDLCLEYMDIMNSSIGQKIKKRIYFTYCIYYYYLVVKESDVFYSPPIHQNLKNSMIRIKEDVMFCFNTFKCKIIETKQFAINENFMGKNEFIDILNFYIDKLEFELTSIKLELFELNSAQKKQKELTFDELTYYCKKNNIDLDEDSPKQKEPDTEQKEPDTEQKEPDIEQKESDIEQKESDIEQKESDIEQKNMTYIRLHATEENESSFYKKPNFYLSDFPIINRKLNIYKYNTYSNYTKDANLKNSLRRIYFTYCAYYFYLITQGTTHEIGIHHMHHACKQKVIDAKLVVGAQNFIYKKEFINIMDKYIDLIEPAIDLIEPAIDLIEPAIDLIEPAIDLIEPAIDLIEPAPAQKPSMPKEPVVLQPKPTLKLVQKEPSRKKPTITHSMITRSKSKLLK